MQVNAELLGVAPCSMAQISNVILSLNSSQVVRESPLQAVCYELMRSLTDPIMLPEKRKVALSFLS